MKTLFVIFTWVTLSSGLAVAVIPAGTSVLDRAISEG